MVVYLSGGVSECMEPGLDILLLTGWGCSSSGRGRWPATPAPPVAQRHVALAHLVDQEVQHLRGALAGLEQHRLPALAWGRMRVMET